VNLRDGWITGFKRLCGTVVSWNTERRKSCGCSCNTFVPHWWCTRTVQLFSPHRLFFSQREWLSWFLLGPTGCQVSWKCSFPGASALCHLFASRVYRGRYCLGLWVSADLHFIQKRPRHQYQMLSNCGLYRLLLWEIAEQM